MTAPRARGPSLQSGTTFTVSGGHSYATHGTYTVGVSITSVAGSSASTSEPASVADAVTTCTSSGCSGTITTTSQVVQINSASTTSTIFTSIVPASASFSCGDQFRHAPQIVTVSDTALNANIVYTVTFANAKAGGSSLVPFAVCYQAQTPFTDLFGHSVTTGLLPLCTLLPRPNKPLVAPCVQSITELPFHLGNVVEKVVVPPGDPRVSLSGRSLGPVGASDCAIVPNDLRILTRSPRAGTRTMWDRWRSLTHLVMPSVAGSSPLAHTLAPHFLFTRSARAGRPPDLSVPAPGRRQCRRLHSGQCNSARSSRTTSPAATITLTFRLWRRPHAKVGGRYRVGRVEIEIETMELVPFASISDADVRRAGEPDRETLRARAAHAGPITDDTLPYRIAFHVVG